MLLTDTDSPPQKFLYAKLLLCCIRPDIRVAHQVELMLFGLHYEFQYSLQYAATWQGVRAATWQGMMSVTWQGLFGDPCSFCFLVF